ncbi:hypothetical protein FRC01_009574 [Tulasnella sp. 417]|nr:hypothetical protein FRC01_009574 [Tulasnella sp. 417]
MENLPPEVLSHVFTFAIPRHGYQEHYVPEMTNQPQAELSLVCRYWEQVVTKTPQVWSYIHLSQTTTEQTLRRRIELSSREPLDVRVDVGDDADVDDSYIFPDLYNILLPTIDRWRSFVFRGIVPSHRSLKRWIPKRLPNVVEAAYYGLVEDDDEGLEMFNHASGELEEYRFKPWTTAPKLRRFVAETAGQFYFTECPLVTEFSLSDIGGAWGGDSDVHSWHDKWEEYFVLLAELCPQLETLELSSSWDSDCVDPMGWTTRETKWPEFAHLRALKIDAVSSPSTIPIIAKFNAPNLQSLHLGHIHYSLPHPLPSVALSINPLSCQVHFDNSPLHAIKLFLEGISQVQELNVSVQLADALGISAATFSFVDERGNDLMGEARRVMEDWTWIKEHTRSVQWILPQGISGSLFSDGDLTAESTSALAITWKMMKLDRQ